VLGASTTGATGNGSRSGLPSHTAQTALSSLSKKAAVDLAGRNLRGTVRELGSSRSSRCLKGNEAQPDK